MAIQSSELAILDANNSSPDFDRQLTVLEILRYHCEGGKPYVFELFLSNPNQSYAMQKSKAS